MIVNFVRGSIKDFKFLTIQTGKHHAGMRILMKEISVFINGNGSCKTIDLF